MLRKKKEFTKGMVLGIAFFVVLAYMFTPNFGGQNAFHASDALFNSISKGSTYYIPQVMEGTKKFEGKAFEVSIFEHDAKMIPYAAAVLQANGLNVASGEAGLKVSGDLGDLMQKVVNDSDAMFKNEGDALSAKYGMEPREAMYVWWKIMKEVKLALDHQKVFAPATFISKYVVSRAIEVGYNYYGIDAQDVTENVWIIVFALVFYVIYTMWWGYSIFFIFDGLGLEMKAGKKKEM
ncbi:hypothetical protein [Pseudodesulfovibrio tunisiensis]|uniref:hypothetical protein n=1 Tax=Pseudodesulfovibrio tunisiensis TaxID=463192 RepID=UPI001FB4865D|nr:hypothetical protein [Pseudodesulfovibrio tunisiensis]